MVIRNAHSPLDQPVAVIDGGGEAAARPSFAVLPDGSLLNLDVATPTVEGGDLRIDATLSLDATASPDTSLLFALDLSGSALQEGEGCGGDVNGDGLFDTILDCELSASKQAVEEVGAWGSVAEIGVVPFYLTGRAADVQPTGGRQSFTEPLADLDGDGELDLHTVLQSAGRVGLFAYGLREFNNTVVFFGFAGRTAFDQAARGVCEALPAASQPERVVLFLSDGQSDVGQHVDTQLPCPEPVTIHTVAVGTDAACDLDPNGWAASPTSRRCPAAPAPSSPTWRAWPICSAGW